ncbi:MAG: hypothetical protein G01um101419_252 [Parcubacteria group bacterium Gr01-1014_19]|nr:MAG: hypothetical protein G01um101419_252 [Parcubacteria group bacterium Gr01-1014_19]
MGERKSKSSGDRPKKQKEVKKGPVFANMPAPPADKPKEEAECSECGFNIVAGENYCRACGVRTGYEELPRADHDDEPNEFKDELLGDLGGMEKQVQMGLDVARAVWPTVKKLVEENQDLLVDVVETIVGVVSDVDDGLSERVDEMMKRNAKRNWNKFNALIVLGFTREEAMQVLLAKSDSNAKLGEYIGKAVAKALERPEKKT